MRSAAFFATLAAVAGFATEALAVVPVYGQCGGLTYSGETTCASGSTCVKSNDYYSQCLPGSNAPTSTTPTTTVTTRTTTVTSSTGGTTGGVCSNRTKFKYFGVNESGAEFGDGKFPGVLGTDYTWPSPSSIDYFVGKGMNSFRVPFLLERISPNGVAGSLDSTYLGGLKTIVNYITGKGAYAIIEPHNYLRYRGSVLTSTSDFQSFWQKLAAEFKSNSNVIFDIVNEPNGVDAGVVFNFNQAGVNGIRAAGATSQLILVEGTAWTGAWSWTSSGNSNYFANIKDPNNNWAVEMHQYLDSDSSGTSTACVSATIGAERVAAATQWCKANNVKCFLGEIGAGSNDVCIAAVKNTLCALQQAGGVWIGATWWAAGPWWGTYFTSIEPTSGAAISRILPEALLPFL